MNEETNVVLKYKRPKEAWVCENCETENDMLLQSCALCGECRTNTAEILKAWSMADETPVKVEEKKVETDYQTTYPEESSTNITGIIWGIVLVVAIILLIAILQEYA